jgi:sulfur-carrier protein
MDVLYFAWVRERIGLPKERVETEAATVADLVAELKRARGTLCHGLSRIFLRPARGASTRNSPISTASLEGAREVAFFPPMTGG